MNRINIDFSNGSISLDDGTLVNDLIERAKPLPNVKEWSIDIGLALLSNIIVHVTGRHTPLLTNINFMPPKNLDFFGMDRCAAEISEAIIRMDENMWHNSHGHFSWGNVKLLSEWRDGGWGAFFSIVHCA
jgi:hypothetical protein